MPSVIPPEIPPAWQQFLADVDNALIEDVHIHCLGGFAITMLFGFKRPTSDVDYIETVPAHASTLLQHIAGRGSPLFHKHGLYFQHVSVASLPESYQERLITINPGRYRHLRLLALDPYDLALSKLTRNHPVDQADVEFLANAVPLDPRILRERYEREFRTYATGDPDWNDQTLNMWIDSYFSSED